VAASDHRHPWLAALVCGAAACNGSTGTLTLTLTEPSGATLLETDIQRIEVTLTSPPETAEADRVGSGFTLSFSVDATGSDGQFFLQGFDGNANLIAVGETPPIPIAAIDATLTIFVAPPLSIGASQSSLEDARRDLTAAATTFGAVLVGGVSANGFASPSIEGFNAFTQSVGEFAPLTVPRVAPAVMVDSSDDLEIFAGSDQDGNPTGSAFELDLDNGGSGTIVDITPSNGSSFARGAALALPLDTLDEFAISGTPALEYATPSTVAAVTMTGVTAAAAPGAAVVGSDGAVTAIFAGDGNPGTGIVRFHAESIDLPTGNPSVLRHGHAVAGAPGGVIIELGGVIDGGGSGSGSGSDEPTADAVLFDPVAGTATVKPSILMTARLNPAVAATSRYLIVAGGQSDDVACTTTTPCTLVPTVEVLDATTFALVTTLNLVVPRTNASAIALPNDQILIVGGTDENGAPTGTVELFTPDLPAGF